MVDYNESKSMYTRATSIRSNFATASVRHNNHHINQNYGHGYLNSPQGKSHIAGGGGGGGKRFSSGDLELKTTTTLSSITAKEQGTGNRKIVFQPIRTASLKNHNSAQNGPLLTGGNGDAFHPEVDLCTKTPLLPVELLDVARPTADANGCGNGDGAGHSCSSSSGVCLSENCPGIMFEDVDL